MRPYSKKQVITEIETAEGLVTNTLFIAEAFNENFVSIGPKLANEISSQPPLIPPPIEHNFTLHPCSVHEVLNIFNDVSDTAPGIDHVKASVIKYIAPIIAKPPSYAVNLLNQGFSLAR